MRKISASVFVASFIVLLSCSGVGAVNSTPSGTTRTRTEAAERVNQNLDAINAKREEIKSRIEEQKQTRETLMEQKREQFQERLQLIKDEQKRNATDKLNTRLTTVQDKWVEHWNNVLTRLEGLLVKLEERDTESEATSEIAAARVAINQAQASIETLSAKVYEIKITTEDGLGDDITAAITIVQDDLAEVRADIKAAHDSVVEVIVVLKNE